MFGIDLSNHQKSIDLTKKHFSFGIVKATEGVTYKDPSFENHVAQLSQLNKLIGCYHFARPDNQTNDTSMIRSADHFLRVVDNEGLIGKAILILDWEQRPTERTDLMEVWLDRVYEATGITPFLYASSSFIKAKKKIIKTIGVPIWAAQWPTNQVMREWPDDFFIEMYNPFETGWTIWQFSSTGTWPGFNGRVDYNYTSMSEKQWKSYAFGKSKCDEEISDDMKWAIDKGIIKGFADGSYRPNDYLTRQQIAVILRRYNDYLNK